MAIADTAPSQLPQRPRRADALRNYEKVLAAAREAFAEGGESTSLEQIARRAGVGIGTLYRHFPTRQALIEALYVEEVQAICRTAAELDGGDPWESLDSWMQALIGYMARKKALAAELLDYMDLDAPLLQTCRSSLYAAAEPLLVRAQAAGVVRPDVTIAQVMQLVMAIVKMPGSDSEQVTRLLRIALDGLRYGTGHPAAG